MADVLPRASFRAMTTLERFVRGLVATTLPLSLLSCGGPAPRVPPCILPPDKIMTVSGGGLPDGGSPGDGGISAADCNAICGAAFYRCSIFSTDGGSTQIDCAAALCTGRRPAGLVPALARTDTVGGWFAEAAHLEAASVPAFARLRRELISFGAPAALVQRCHAAARDEVGHARAMRSLAARFGATAAPVELAPFRTRSLEELAVENAVEGCTRELFGAVVGVWQSEAANDPEIRAAMRGIAADEIRHAELAFAIADWAAARLPAAARARVAEARQAALAEVRREAAAQRPAELMDVAGLPPPAAAEALAAAVSCLTLA